MVERLAEAIAKAREQRGAAAQPHDAAAPRPQVAMPAAPVRWSEIEEVALDPVALERGRVITVDRTDPNYVLFDILRTRLLRACVEHGWRRIGVTSPTKECGKTLLVANLALSLGRLPDARTLALDLDLRAPRLAARLGLKAPGPIVDLLSGAVAHRAALRRVGERLAFGFNSRPERDSAERLQSNETRAAFDTLEQALDPTLTLCDLPPLLVGDDAMAGVGLLDGVLVVAAAGRTTPAQIEESIAMLNEVGKLVGTVLNGAEVPAAEFYTYGAEDS